jgi:hypothetical protein
LLYSLQHTGKIFDHIAVPESEHAIAATGQLAGAQRVRFLSFYVLTAVQLYSEPTARTCKIHDVRADRMLSAKTMPTVQCSKRQPEPLLDLCRIPPQTTGDPCSSSQH